MFQNKAHSFGLIIIGDEVISGRVKDQHLTNVIGLLKSIQQPLDWSYCIGDDLDGLVNLFKHSLSWAQRTQSTVLVTGGIGATPDDRTRDAVGMAFNSPIQPHAEGITLLENKFGTALSEHQKKLVTFPTGSNIIPNAINGVPGFSILHHYFVPGFPSMAKAMFEWVLSTHFSQLPPRLSVEMGVRVFGVSEGAIAPLLVELERTFNGVLTFSLPSTREDEKFVDVGVKGLDDTQAQLGLDWLCSALDALKPTEVKPLD